MSYRLMRKRVGFTLIEVLVVVGIIALLTAITMPSFAEARRISKKTVCLHNLHEIGVAVHSYLLSNRDTFPYIARLPTAEVAVALAAPVPRQPYVPMPVALKKETGGNGQSAKDYAMATYDAALKQKSTNGQLFLCPADQITKDSLLAQSAISSMGPRYFDSQKTSYEW